LASQLSARAESCPPKPWRRRAAQPARDSHHRLVLDHTASWRSIRVRSFIPFRCAGFPGNCQARFRMPCKSANLANVSICGRLSRHLRSRSGNGQPVRQQPVRRQLVQRRPVLRRRRPLRPAFAPQQRHSVPHILRGTRPSHKPQRPHWPRSSRQVLC